MLLFQRCSRFLVIAFSALSLMAQGERATITGTIKDTTGAVVPAAAVSARNTATGVTIRNITNDSGLYSIPALPPGSYTVRVEKTGFRSMVVDNVTLTVGLTANIDAVLVLGNVTETVEVQANAAMLETQTSGLGKAIETRRVVELPLLGRNPLQLASLVPGVIPTSGQQGNGSGSIGSATNARISGGLAQQNAVLIDGGESRGVVSNGSSYSVPLESVAEFRIESATYSAEFGRAGGGIANIATKSGANELHGVAYEFFRNDHLNANGWQNNRNSIPRGLFQRNEFGGALGGKIIKDRTFWFANFESVRQGSPFQYLGTVPTELQRSGDFSQTRDRNGNPLMIYDYLTTRPDPNNPGKSLRDPFPGNRITPDRINPISAAVMKYYPASNRQGEGASLVNNFFQPGKNVNNINSWFSRIDHVFSDKHRIYGRYGGSTNNSFTGGVTDPIFPATSRGEFPTMSAMISDTYTFSPNLLGEFRISFTRLNNRTVPSSEGFDLATLGFPSSVTNNVRYKQFPNILIQTYNAGTGLTVTNASPNEVDQLGNSTATIYPQDTWHAQYHLTWIRGKHRMKIGGEGQLIRMFPYNSQYSAGQYAFDRYYTQGPDPTVTALNSGSGLASMLLGVPVAGTLTFTNPLFLYQKYWGAYFQDDYRISSKLTLNLGLRYEYVTPYAEKFGQIGYFDPEGTEPVTGMKGVFKWIKPGGYQSNPNRKNFSPRIGLAYQLASKTVIRAGAAIFYATNNGVNAASTDFGNGSFVSNFVSLGAPNSLPNTPPVGGSWNNPFAGGFAYPVRDSSFAGQAIRGDILNHPAAAVNNWSFSVQHSISSTMIAEVGYVGSKITHLFWNRQWNQNDPALASLGSSLRENVANPFFGKIQSGALSFPTVERRQLLRPYPQYSDVLVIRDPYGDGSYQSMIARFEKRYGSGVSLSFAYTLSKAIASTAESNTWVVGPSNALYDAKYNRSLEANDATHRAVISTIWDVPLGKGRRFLNHGGVVNAVMGGWQMSGITVFQSGRPVLITGPDNTGLYNFSYTNGRTNRLKDPLLPSDQQSLTKWFDTSAFAAAAPYTIPNDSLSQPNLRGPGRVNWDMSFIKNTRIRERVNMQFRAEFFNLFNTPAFEMRGTSTEVSSAQFGQVVLAGNQRNVQFGMRVVF